MNIGCIHIDTVENLFNQESLKYSHLEEVYNKSFLNHPSWHVRDTNCDLMNRDFQMKLLGSKMNRNKSHEVTLQLQISDVYRGRWRKKAARLEMSEDVRACSVSARADSSTFSESRSSSSRALCLLIHLVHSRLPSVRPAKTEITTRVAGPETVQTVS